MADLDSSAFLLFSIKDDSVYIQEALFLLDYDLPFAELDIRRQCLVLTCAALLKPNEGKAKFAES